MQQVNYRRTEVGVEANDRLRPRHSGEGVLHGALVPLGEGGHGEGTAHNVLEDGTPPVDRARHTQDDVLLGGGGGVRVQRSHMTSHSNFDNTESHDQSQ